MLTNALTASLSSLSRSEREFTVISQNVANADDSKYSALQLNTRPAFSGNILSGVDIVSISSKVDEVLQGRLYERTAQATYDEDIEQYYQQIIAEFGPLVGNLGLDKQIHRLFTALDNVSSQPSSVGIKQIAALELKETADNLSRLAGHLYQMQLDIDQRLYTTISEVNKLLSDAFISSQTMKGVQNGSIERVKSEQDFRSSIEELSQYFELYTFTDEMQRWRAFSKQGDTLVGDIRYFLKYTPQQTTKNFIDGSELNPLMISAYNQSGSDLNIDHPMVKAASSGQSENRYNSGRIGALLNVRDKIIPELLSQIDNLAKNFKDHFNQAHNLGCGFPPPNTLTATKLTGYNDIPGITGKARIVILNDQGIQAPGITPLTLDFDKLDTGAGEGNGNVSGIMHEIQYHFGSRMVLDKSVSLGSLSDIKLASKSKSIDPNSNFILDLELSNFSQLNTDVQILSVTAADSLSNNILGSFNNTSALIPKGAITRTGVSGPSISLAIPATINYPFEITLNVNANDGVNNDTSTFKYIITAPIPNEINGIINYRFSVDSKINPMDPGTINLPPIPAAVLYTTLVDQYGAHTNVDTLSKGLMKISTSGSNYRIAIDNMDSKYLGELLSNSLQNEKNFSSYFGLNDIFVRNDDPIHWSDTKNTALFLNVRDDIAQNTSYLSSAMIMDKINTSNPAEATYEYHINIGDNAAIRKMQELSTKNIFFASAGGLAAVDISIGRYTESIIAFTANMHDFTRVKGEQSSLLREAISEKIQNIRGVDVNEEMMKMIIFQHSYAASAKIIGVIKEMMQTMIAMFN